MPPFEVKGPRFALERDAWGTRMRGGSVAMSAYDFSARDLKTGQVTELSQYEGKVSLIVNVASKCAAERLEARENRKNS